MSTSFRFTPLAALSTLPIAVLALACGGSGDSKSPFTQCAAGTEPCAGRCVPAGTCDPAGSGGGSSTGGGAGESTGAQSATGGNDGTGGQVSGFCGDTSNDQGIISDQYGNQILSTLTNKTYALHANWWFMFSNQRIDYDGLGFAVTSQSADVGATEGRPAGYPSIFLGTYSGLATTGSNLPKQVSALTSVPTVFNTNSLDLDTNNFNAAYDVWFTQSSGPLPETQYDPGVGGAYLMVWLFKPSNRQPRGQVQASRQTVGGAPSTWDVWVDPSNPPCISYVSTTPMSDIEFDLNDFIQDSATNHYGVTDSMYLSVVFGGFEIWSGAEGVQLEQFCVDVK